jgi:hypothetical protein
VSSGDWTGFSTSSTVSAGSRTLTGTGTIKFVVTVTGCSAKYSYNGGSFTTFTNGATLAVTNGTLALEITGSGSGSECIGTIVDNSNSATIGNVDIENTL